MKGRGLGTWLSLAHQTVSLELEFGRRALEAMVSIAETVEESVYEPGSLTFTPTTLTFALANPPLRAGAFRAVRLVLNEAAVPPAALALRAGDQPDWTRATSVSPTVPFEFRPGRRTSVRIDPWARSSGGPVRVRLELESVAIPPLVWLEFEDTPREGAVP